MMMKIDMMMTLIDKVIYKDNIYVDIDIICRSNKDKNLLLNFDSMNMKPGTYIYLREIVLYYQMPIMIVQWQ